MMFTWSDNNVAQDRLSIWPYKSQRETHVVNPSETVLSFTGRCVLEPNPPIVPALLQNTKHILVVHLTGTVGLMAVWYLCYLYVSCRKNKNINPNFTFGSEL